MKELNSLLKAELKKPFADELIYFCDQLSKEIFKAADKQLEADYFALAFFLRKAHFTKIKEDFFKNPLLKKPIGIVFHIPPASIDVMLVYSWITALILGNKNIIRIPQNKSSNLLLRIIFNLLNDPAFASIKEMNLFLEYGHEIAITREISSISDARIIWGGDETVNTISKIPLKDKAINITFPDRFSYTLIDAKNYLESSTEKLTRFFFNDAYFFDQSACSSPKMILWLGDEELTQKASHLFYAKLKEYIVNKSYKLAIGSIMLKKNFLYNQALSLPVEEVKEFSNELSVMQLSFLHPNCRIHCGFGLFYNVNLLKIEELINFINEKDQTLSYFGVNEETLNQLRKKTCLKRIVPIGSALNFDIHWDGHNLLQELSTC